MIKNYHNNNNNLYINNIKMKIIIRDIFETYFPKHYSNYQKILKQQVQVSEKRQQSKLQKVYQLNELQEDVPEVLGNRRSSAISRGKKNIQLPIIRQKSKQQLTTKKSPFDEKQIKQNQQQNTKSTLSNQEKQKLRQLMNQKLTDQIKLFIKQHRFFTKSINVETIMSQIDHLLLRCLSLKDTNQPKQLSKSNITNITTTSQQFIAQNLYKLSLYLNKQTNKQIFTVYEYILSSPKSGISYQTLSKRLKTDIINVSHYCCKLKKMRFIDWEHKKQGIIVFPKVSQKTNKTSSTQKDQYELTKVQLNAQNQQQEFSYQKSFIFNELTLNENILVNLCSATSLSQGGLTNEEIKFKIMKHAQNKMVRRTVEGMKHVQKNAQRQGKVFEFKYKKQTQRVIKEMDKKRADGIGQLTQKCRDFLNNNFVAKIGNEILQNEQLLQHIVNTKLTDYISSIGIKQSKRQCTPLKLNRYISILNYLQIQGSETQLDLRRYIIEIEKDLDSYQGIIHKRSVIGILQGLKKIGLIYQIDGWFYPAWCQVQKKEKPALKKMSLDQYEDQDVSHILRQGINGSKKLKQDKSSKSKSKLQIPPQKIRMITKKQHLNQIFTQILSITFQKAMKRTLRKGFHRIMYVHRKKQTVPMFQSEKNLFYLLQNETESRQKWKNLPQPTTTIESFMSQVNDFIDIEGKKLENFPQIEYEFVKYVRRNPVKMADNLRSKYGKSWREKFQPLSKAGVIQLSQNGYSTLNSFNGLLV